MKRVMGIIALVLSWSPNLAGGTIMSVAGRVVDSDGKPIAGA